jgi:hypothetical protein
MLSASCEDAIAQATFLAAQRKRASVRPYPTAPALNIESNRNYTKQILLPFGQVWSHRKFGELGFTTTGDGCSVTSNGHPADVVLDDLGRKFDHSTVGMNTVSVGLSGGSGGATNLSPEPRTAPAAPRSSMPIPVLGVSVAQRQEGGARIVSVVSGSVADLAYMHVGDVIDEVDGKAVKTPMELAAELSGRPPGSKVRIGYQYRNEAMGYWPKTTAVILGQAQ